MDERAKELRRAYKREWNRKNRDKVKAAQVRYWERKRQRRKRRKLHRISRQANRGHNIIS